MLAYMLSRQLQYAVLLLLSCGCASAHWDAAEPLTSSQVIDPAAPQVWRQVAVIGASASAGFGTSTSMTDALELIVKAEHEPIVHTATGMFFLAPERTAKKQLAETLAADPSIVVALDFLFWFTYGSFPEAERMAFLEEGLALLEEVECPLVIGTVPDMSAAVGKMLSRRQVPTPETLAAANARILQWAEDRGSVVIISLPDLLANLKASKPFVIHGELWSPPAGVELLQWDQLHPTVTGLASMACYIAGSIAESFGLNANDLVLDADEVAAQLVLVTLKKKRDREERRSEKSD